MPLLGASGGSVLASHLKSGSRRGQVVLPTRDAPFAACKEQFM